MDSEEVEGGEEENTNDDLQPDDSVSNHIEIQTDDDKLRRLSTAERREQEEGSDQITSR